MASIPDMDTYPVWMADRDPDRLTVVRPE